MLGVVGIPSGFICFCRSVLVTLSGFFIDLLASTLSWIENINMMLVLFYMLRELYSYHPVPWESHMYQNRIKKRWRKMPVQAVDLI